MKDRRTAGLLAIFLGTLGVHKFYLGQNLNGIIFLLLIGLFPAGTIISVIQGIIWLLQTNERFYAIHGVVDDNTTQIIVDSSSSFINSNLVKAKKYSQKKISKSYLTGCAWALASEMDNILYIFRDNNNLIVSKNGLVEKRTYELLIDNNSILIGDDEKTELYNIVLVQDDFLFLNKVSENRILRFVNQTKVKDLLKKDLIKMVNDTEKDYNNIQVSSEPKYNTGYNPNVDNVINNMVSGNVGEEREISLNTKFYYIEKTKIIGPVTGKKLVSLVKTQRINRNCFVRQESEKNFKNRAYEIVELLEK